ncbi:hypothetical protein [Saprospira grandis]|nr:hypothetical protein [Saprospira grandis]
MEYLSKMSLLLLSMSGFLFFSSCGEEPPQKTTAKDSLAEPIVEGDTTWTDGKITRLSSSKFENDTLEVGLMVYSPKKDSSSARISIYKETSTYSSSGFEFLKSVTTSKDYSIAIDSFRGLDLFNPKNIPLKEYLLMEYIPKDNYASNKSISMRSNTKEDRGLSFDPKVIPTIIENEFNKKLDSESAHIIRKSYFHMNGDYIFSYIQNDTGSYILADSISKKMDSLPKQFIESSYLTSTIKIKSWTKKKY